MNTPQPSANTSSPGVWRTFHLLVVLHDHQLKNSEHAVTRHNKARQAYCRHFCYAAGLKQGNQGKQSNGRQQRLIIVVIMADDPSPAGQYAYRRRIRKIRDISSPAISRKLCHNDMPKSGYLRWHRYQRGRQRNMMRTPVPEHWKWQENPARERGKYQRQQRAVAAKLQSALNSAATATCCSSTESCVECGYGCIQHSSCGEAAGSDEFPAPVLPTGQFFFLPKTRRETTPEITNGCATVSVRALPDGKAAGI